MTAEPQFAFVDVLGLLLAPVLVIAILSLPRPHRFWLRGVIAVAAGWLSAVLFMAFVLPMPQPADGPYGDDPVGIALAFGWFCPAVLVLLFAGIRYLWRRLRRNHVP